jgi:ATP adenylyltransferase
MNAPADWERLWAPHRMPYLQGENRSVNCVFCEAPKPGHDDLVVFKGETVFVVMNLYPYNSGHLLICPYRHVADLTDLTPAESTEIVALTAHSILELTKVRCQVQELLIIFINIWYRAGRGIRISCQSLGQPKSWRNF